MFLSLPEHLWWISVQTLWLLSEKWQKVYGGSTSPQCIASRFLKQFRLYLLAIGVGTGEFLEVRRNFARILPNLPERYFKISNLQKNALHVNSGAIIFKSLARDLCVTWTCYSAHTRRYQDQCCVFAENTECHRDIMAVFRWRTKQVSLFIDLVLLCIRSLVHDLCVTWICESVQTRRHQRWPESLFGTPTPLLFQNLWIRVQIWSNNFSNVRIRLLFRLWLQ